MSKYLQFSNSTILNVRHFHRRYSGALKLLIVCMFALLFLNLGSLDASAQLKRK